MKNLWKISAVLFLGTPLCLAVNSIAQFEKAQELQGKSTPAQAATPQEKAPQTATPQENPPAKTDGPYWLGVIASPVPDVLLSNFGGKEGGPGLLVVEKVIDNSPVAKAGLLRGDVLLQFAGKDIHTLADLVNQVEQVKGTAQPLIVLRAGKKIDLTVTPEPLPEEPVVIEEEFMDEVPDMTLSPEGRRFFQHPRRMMRQMEHYFRQMPGGVDEGRITEDDEVAEFDDASGGEGKRLAVSTTTDKDGNTKVHVTRTVTTDGKTERQSWEADSIENLPDEIREDVQALFGP